LGSEGAKKEIDHCHDRGSQARREGKRSVHCMDRSLEDDLLGSGGTNETSYHMLPCFGMRIHETVRASNAPPDNRFVGCLYRWHWLTSLRIACVSP
jgi:hypothetical protein